MCRTALRLLHHGVPDPVRHAGEALQQYELSRAKKIADALAKVYVDGQRLSALVPQSSSAGTAALGLDKLQYVAASASAEDDGVRVQGATKGGPGGGDFASSLIGGVPGDAFALLDFTGKGTTDQLGKLKSNPQAAKRSPTSSRSTASRSSRCSRC